MAIRRALSLVLLIAAPALALAAWQAPTPSPASPASFVEVIQHHARAGIADIRCDGGGAVLVLDRAWNADTGAGHDEAKHWRLAELGSGWVRFDHPSGGTVYAPLDRIVIRRN